MLQWCKKRLALRRIAKRLPGQLQRLYGTTDSYSAQQVREALKQHRYDPRFWGYAFAMCLVAEEAAGEVGGAVQVDALRGELAERYFDGDTAFTLEAARMQGAGGDRAMDGASAHGLHGDGGGFDVGGGDGGSA